MYNCLHMRLQVLRCLPQQEGKSRKVTSPVSTSSMLNVKFHHPHRFPKPMSACTNVVTLPHDSHTLVDKKSHNMISNLENLLTSHDKSE